jgi:hypothetical protein
VSTSDPNGSLYSPYIPTETSPASQAEELLRKQSPVFEISEGPKRRYPPANNALDLVIQGIEDPEFDPNKPYHGINSEPDLDIKLEPVVAGPRRLKMTWSAEAASELRDLWGSGAADNALDIFTEGLDDPAFDPNKKYRGKKGSAEQELIDAMIKEMTEEIDKEILASLKGPYGL